MRQLTLGCVLGSVAGQRSRSIVELALLHQRVGKQGSHIRRESPRRPPRLAGGERFAAFGFRFGQLTSPNEGLRTIAFHPCESENRSAPVCLRECFLIDEERFVEIGHRQDCGAHAARPSRRQGVSVEQRSAGQRAARQGHGCRRACSRVVVGDEREQLLLAESLAFGPAADALQPLGGFVIEARFEECVADESRLEETLELGFGAAQLVQRLSEDGVRLVGAQHEKMKAEYEGGLRSPDRVVE